MNFDDNFVRIFKVLPDVKPTKLTAAYDKSSTDPLQVTAGTADVDSLPLKVLLLVQLTLDYF